VAALDETKTENLRPNYTRGFEDALELSLELTKEKSNLEEIQSLTYQIGYCSE